MEKKQKQEQIQQAYIDNELSPAELLERQRQRPLLPLAVMALSVLTAVGGRLPAVRQSRTGRGGGSHEEDEERSSPSLFTRRKRHQR